MYDIVKNGDQSQLLKRSSVNEPWQFVALLFNTDMSEALRMRDVLNNQLAASAHHYDSTLGDAEETADEERLDGEAWKPASNPSYDDTGA